jgi:hypothetical protein
MSLINDALKRASQSDRNRPRQAAVPAAMEPAAGANRSPLPLVLAAGVVVALALAGWFFWQWWIASHHATAANPPAPAQAVIAAAPPPPPAPPPAQVETPAVPVAKTEKPPGAAEKAADAAPAAAPAAAAPPAEKPWPVELTLKAIFYSKAAPRALVNGRMVAPGDQFDGVTVTQIESNRVVVEWNGQSKELLMGQ